MKIEWGRYISRRYKERKENEKKKQQKTKKHLRSENSKEIFI